MDRWYDYWMDCYVYHRRSISRTRDWAFAGISIKANKDKDITKHNKNTRYRRGCWR